MRIVRILRRYIAILLITAGFTYPACALVCPKGIGGCISPGKCFLFVDADGNSLCDYTVAPKPAADPGAAPPRTLPDALPADLFAATPLFPFIMGVSLFLFLTAALSVLLGKRFPGTGVQRTPPALALAAVPSLCLSLVATGILAGEAVAGTVFALVYITAGTLLAAYLWYAGAMTRRIAQGMAACGALTGFVFLAPIMPLEAGWLINVVTGAPLPVFSVVALCTVLFLTLVFGRVFCGNICPVGAIQELAYAVPGKKIRIRRTGIFELIRPAVFIATIAAFAHRIDLMASTGLYDLFSLTLTGGFLIAAGLIVLSVFLYRPICRFLCPFGLVFSLLAEFSVFRLRRNESCIRCKKCETSCPTGVAGEDRSKRECYFCGRCTDACPRDAALAYRR